MAQRLGRWRPPAPWIVASLAAGTTIIAFRPGDDSMLLLSMLFGAGAALTLDEFALLLHLDNVYWTREGRSSIEAMLMGFAFGALCLLATAPLASDPSKDIPHWVLRGVIVVNTSFALVAFLKGKAKLGAFGVLSLGSRSSPPSGSPSPAHRGRAASTPLRKSTAASHAR